MATYTGSGKFVAIAASDTQFDDLLAENIHGVVFGNGENPYLKISARYIVNNSNVVTGTALSIDPGSPGERLLIDFNSMYYFVINGYYGYSNSITVASGCTLDPNTWIETTQYTTYYFKNGLFVGT